MPNKVHGLTLIEVLIALAIVSIALTAVIKATAQHIRSTTYVQNKTKALWAGELIMNEIRIGLRRIASDDASGKTILLDKNWYWYVQIEPTPNNRIRKITLNIFEHEEDKDQEKTPLIQLESYVYGKG